MVIDGEGEGDGYEGDDMRVTEMRVMDMRVMWEDVRI
jgi:hypothetical protein